MPYDVIPERYARNFYFIEKDRNFEETLITNAISIAR